MISIGSKPAFQLQTFCSSSIRKRRIRSSLCVVAGSLTRMHSRRRQQVSSISLIISQTSCSLFGKITFSKKQINRELSSTCSPGCLRFLRDNSSWGASPIGAFSALALSYAALSIGGVWEMTLYGAPLKPLTSCPALLLQAGSWNRSCSTPGSSLPRLML